MTPTACLVSLLSYLVIVPAAFLCFAPMKNMLKFGRKKTLAAVVAVLAVLIPLSAFLECRFRLSFNKLFLPVTAILFILYALCLNAHISQAGSIYVYVCALMSFAVNFSIFFDAILHPSSDLEHFSPEAAVAKLALCLVFCLILQYFFRKYTTYLIDNLSDHRIWLVTIILSSVFLYFNISMAIHYYETLHTHNVRYAYISAMTVMFILHLLFGFLFYFIVRKLLEQGGKNERYRILEMQEKQFLAQQRYLKDTAKARHDFKHALRTLRTLLSEKDYDAMDAFLTEYADALPENEITEYCSNSAINATLNFYAAQASSHGIRTVIRLQLPEKLFVSDTDFCSILGNILENAITACQNMTGNSGFISLSVKNVHDNEIYIAAENDHGGELRKRKDRYVSTKQDGKGIGLISIASIAEKYHGYAAFSHDSGKFYSNVYLRNERI
ncbi:MAG: GHKL domain-containing protein [Lachnospiraceae bacterium]|nr:GHKL domain-containing protein [Lachnospiraceae bacterium]